MAPNFSYNYSAKLILVVNGYFSKKDKHFGYERENGMKTMISVISRELIPYKFIGNAQRF